MGFLRPKMPAQILPPIPPIPPPAPIKARTDDLKEEAQQELKRRKGTQATILTSGTGLTTEPEVTAPSLLGSVEPPS